MTAMRRRELQEVQGKEGLTLRQAMAQVDGNVP